MLLNCAGHQFLACAGLSCNQNAGVGRSDLGYTRKHYLKGRGSSYDLLEHECLIDLLPQRKVFVAHPLLGPLAILDIGPSRVPANNVPLIVAKRIVTDQKPTIVTVLSKRPLLKFKRLTAHEPLMALPAQPFHILGVENPCALVFSLNVLQ